MPKSNARKGDSRKIRAQDFKTLETGKQRVNRLMDAELYKHARVEVVRRQLPFPEKQMSLGPGAKERAERLQRFLSHHNLTLVELAAHLEHLGLGQPGMHCPTRHGVQRRPHGA